MNDNRKLGYILANIIVSTGTACVAAIFIAATIKIISWMLF